MPVPAAVVAAAAVVFASGTAMLAGAHADAPAGPPLAVPHAAPPLARADQPMPAEPPIPGLSSLPGLGSVAGPGASAVSGSASHPGSVPGLGSGSVPAPGSGSVPGLGPGAVAPSVTASALATPSMATPSAAASPFASGAIWTTVNCAEVRIRVSGGAPLTDVGGPLVPAGATTVTRCETPLASARPGRSAFAVATPKVLTTSVDRFAAVLNALPSVPADQACLPITLPVQVSLVFTLPEQQPLAVIVDPACSALIAGDRARSYATLNPLPIFDRLYAAQPATP